MLFGPLENQVETWLLISLAVDDAGHTKQRKKTTPAVFPEVREGKQGGCLLDLIPTPA